jgi:hypothetical protein
VSQVENPGKAIPTKKWKNRGRRRLVISHSFNLLYEPKQKNEAERGRTTYVRRKVAIDLFDKENNNPLKLYSLVHVVPTCTNE